MPEDPLKVFEELDPELLKLVRHTSELALAEGALPKKVKLLIAMALDAAHGAVGGVRALARMAMEAGATKQEVAEALRVPQYVSGEGACTRQHTLFRGCSSRSPLPTEPRALGCTGAAATRALRPCGLDQGVGRPTTQALRCVSLRTAT